ncbi:MAG: SDR family NAD(P)-dependent oxidoreductase [Solobacterium sp.]|nr:SDR family NAD(P)-dependent oxidoreductase [Solobacterium sp.]
MTKTALITGASSGIGEAIASSLLQEQWEVYGVGRDFSSCELPNNPLFHACVFDLSLTEQIPSFLNSLSLSSLDLLINCAGCAWYGPHETISVNSIQQMTRVNLEAPMVLCGCLIRSLRASKGMVINISSVTALETSTHGAAYGALKAGLYHFGRTLFEENRKHRVRVCTILPDLTDTDLYRNAEFGPDCTPGAYLTAEQVAEAVSQVIHQPEGTLISELTLQPQLHRISRKPK